MPKKLSKAQAKAKLVAATVRDETLKIPKGGYHQMKNGKNTKNQRRNKRKDIQSRLGESSGTGAISGFAAPGSEKKEKRWYLKESLKRAVLKLLESENLNAPPHEDYLAQRRRATQRLEKARQVATARAEALNPSREASEEPGIKKGQKIPNRQPKFEDEKGRKITPEDLDWENLSPEDQETLRTLIGKNHYELGWRYAEAMNKKRDEGSTKSLRQRFKDQKTNRGNISKYIEDDVLGNFRNDVALGQEEGMDPHERQSKVEFLTKNSDLVNSSTGRNFLNSFISSFPIDLVDEFEKALRVSKSRPHNNSGGIDKQDKVWRLFGKQENIPVELLSKFADHWREPENKEYVLKANQELKREGENLGVGATQYSGGIKGRKAVDTKDSPESRARFDASKDQDDPNVVSLSDLVDEKETRSVTDDPNDPERKAFGHERRLQDEGDPGKGFEEYSDDSSLEKFSKDETGKDYITQDSSKLEREIEGIKGDLAFAVAKAKELQGHAKKISRRKPKFKEREKHAALSKKISDRFERYKKEIEELKISLKEKEEDYGPVDRKNRLLARTQGLKFQNKSDTGGGISGASDTAMSAEFPPDLPEDPSDPKARGRENPELVKLYKETVFSDKFMSRIARMLARDKSIKTFTDENAEAEEMSEKEILSFLLSSVNPGSGFKKESDISFENGTQKYIYNTLRKKLNPGKGFSKKKDVFDFLRNTVSGLEGSLASDAKRRSERSRSRGLRPEHEMGRRELPSVDPIEGVKREQRRRERRDDPRGGVSKRPAYSQPTGESRRAQEREDSERVRALTHQIDSLEGRISDSNPNDPKTTMSKARLRRLKKDRNQLERQNEQQRSLANVRPPSESGLMEYPSGFKGKVKKLVRLLKTSEATAASPANAGSLEVNERIVQQIKGEIASLFKGLLPQIGDNTKFEREVRGQMAKYKDSKSLEDRLSEGKKTISMKNLKALVEEAILRRPRSISIFEMLVGADSGKKLGHAKKKEKAWEKAKPKNSKDFYPKLEGVIRKRRGK